MTKKEFFNLKQGQVFTSTFGTEYIVKTISKDMLVTLHHTGDLVYYNKEHLSPLYEKVIDKAEVTTDINITYKMLTDARRSIGKRYNFLDSAIGKIEKSFVDEKQGRLDV